MRVINWFSPFQENASEYQLFPLPDSSECNKLLAAKAINFRLIMFLLSKKAHEG